MSTFAKDLARGCGRSVTFQIIAMVVGLPLSCLFVFVPLIFLSAMAYQPWAIVVAALMWFVPFVALIVGIPAVVVWRRNARLDPIFTPLGLEPDVYMTFFRQYHGTARGRQVDVYFYRGPVLEIEVDTALQARLGVTGPQADTRAFAGLVGRQPLALDDPALRDLTVFAPDAAWARALLSDPRVVGLLRRLIDVEGSNFTRHQVILRPGTLKLMLSGNRKLLGFEVLPEQGQAWLDDLLRLVEQFEAGPAPQETAQLSALEQRFQERRGRNRYLTLWVALASFGVIMLISGVIVVAVFLLAGLEGF